MGVDWTKIRNEYINTDIGMRPLAEKYGVGANTLKSRATREKWAKARTKQCVQTAYKCVQKSAQAVATAEADRLSAAARIRAKATQYLDKRMETLLESGQKAYEVKVVMETLRLIADMEKSDAGAAEEAAVQIVEDLTQ